MKTKKPELSQSAIDYMGHQWGFYQGTEGYDDLQLFWDRGYYQLVASRLIGAGAIEPNCSDSQNIWDSCYTWKEERADVDAALAESPYACYVCNKCNHHHFVDHEACFNEPKDFLGPEGYCHGCASKSELITSENYYSKFKGAKK